MSWTPTLASLCSTTLRQCCRRERVPIRPRTSGCLHQSFFELYYGAYKSSQTTRNLELLDRMAFETVPFDAADARAAGSVRNQLEAAGCPIGPYGLLIAGQALARGLTLVTANVREFQRVGGLDCEDWTAA